MDPSVTPTSSPFPEGKGVGGLGPSAALRFALLGSPQQLNAWSLFDQAGAAYADRALHAGEYPSLYRLSVPAREFEPYIAAGLPSAISQEGDFYTATVKLQTGLRWSDGSPLTAADAAFTANTALAFALGQDWSAAYDPVVLQRAETVDEWTVRFFFKRPPTVADWQYGMLQGPIVSQACWSPKLAEAEALLPPAEVLDDLAKAQAEAAGLQRRIADDQALLLTTAPGTPEYNDLSTRIKRSQDDLNAADNKITKLQDQRDVALAAARQVLFGLSGSDEPTFGPYLRAVISGSLYTRQADSSYPFAKPNFGRVTYAFFVGAQPAGEALTKGDVDAILAPGGLPPELVSQVLSVRPSFHLLRSPSASARFLALNPSKAVLSDPPLRQALSCALDRLALAGALQAQPLDGFVLPGTWKNPQAAPSCAYAPGDPAPAALLRGAGYRWAKEPAPDQPGEGLVLPNGSPFPEMTLLSPDAQSDPQRAEAARLVVQYARALGIPLTAQYVTPEDLRYAVYSSGRYDLALMGWRLGEYPGYLCQWFQPPGAFAYPDAVLQSACDRLHSTADLGTARAALYEVQSVLMRDLPLIPLYQGVEFDLVQNASWPSESVFGGLSGLYGAPELASP